MPIFALRRKVSRQLSTSAAWVALITALVLAALGSAPVARSSHSPLPSTPNNEATASPPAYVSAPVPGTFSDDGPWVVRAHFQNRSMVEELAAWREPWEVNYDQGYLVLDVSRDDFAHLLSSGFRVEIDRDLTAQMDLSARAYANQVTGIPGFPCYRTVEETYAAAEAITSLYPSLAAWIDIGDSWEKTQPGGAPGFDLMVLRLTNALMAGQKPILFVMSSIHARELAPAELLTRFAEHLVENYGSDPDVTWLLDYHEIHLLLQANPDGRKWAEGGNLWRKNTDNSYCSDTPMRGVDLNRNFDFEWGCCDGSSGIQCNEVYRGPSAASEPETQAIQDYARAVFPDQREDSLSSAVPITAAGVFLDLHSYSERVLWPWGFSGSPAPNGTALQTLGRKLAHFSGYAPSQAYELYPTDGTADDFAYGELGLASYTFELGTTFFQDCAAFEETILPDNLLALNYAAKVARTPYLTPAGPDALDVVVTPETLMSGRAIRLTATIDDTRFSDQVGSEPTQNIGAAEFYLDIPPWVMGATAHARTMMAQDGTFDETIEQVGAALGTIGIDKGRHIIFVRGQDAAGNWGAISAVAFEIESEAVSWTYLPFLAQK